MFMLGASWDQHTPLLRIQMCCRLPRSTQSSASSHGGDGHLIPSFSWEKYDSQMSEQKGELGAKTLRMHRAALHSLD